ncbi:Cystathionine beta-lyase, Bsu PatB [hydrothermal vent metagenome]|uniref:cysteine-S-conjugate beta-lyase n=1 Tax=hydrothermal vent metagenome TaxID=652676 RepID=A0A3B1E5R1_9ZZZZ
MKSTLREKSNSEKYKLRKKRFGTNDVTPVWVADMDINTPYFVLKAVRKRLKHPILGYEDIPKSLFKSQIKWMKKQHNVNIKLKDMIYLPSVVSSINVTIKSFSDVGDNIIVQTPVYPPFFESIKKHNREVLENKLKQNKNGGYTFDIKDLKSKINKKTKILLLCNPHNPVGRVWTKKELTQILNICVKNNIIVFSDEIHSDLVYSPNKHISFSSLNTNAKNISITATGVGKTFNMAGFAISSIVISNKFLKNKFLHSYNKIHFSQGATLSHIACETAYKKGFKWLEELKIDLYSNYKGLEKLCNKYQKLIKLIPIEATYLAWLDCRGMKLNDKQLNSFFIKDAKLGLSQGISFGGNGSGFMRLNFAVSKTNMIKIINQLEQALKKINFNKRKK